MFDRLQKALHGLTARVDRVVLGSQPARSEALTPLQEARRQLRRAERQIEEGKRAKRRAARLKEEVAALQTRLAQKASGHEVEGIQPERIVWVFGSGRTGSTWLSGMMQALPKHARWNEPQVGQLFGHLYHQRTEESREDRDNFILANGYRETWLSSIRGLVLNGATARFGELAQREGYLVIKEPHGSVGAPLLMEALPESRMVFLVRDPRDVVASALHTRLEGARARFVRADRMEMPVANPDRFVISHAETYLVLMRLAKQAYEAHEGRKVLIRYEDLKANTLETMKHLYVTLDIPVEDEELRRVVEQYAIENIPEHKKGPGTVRRRAASGGWREDLTPKQADLVESITAPLLEEFYGLVPKAPVAGGGDIDALRRAYARRDVDLVLSFYADDARLRIVNRLHPPSTPYELHGKEQIAGYQRRTFDRDMEQRLEREVVGEDEVAFRLVREYPSEGRLLSDVVLRLNEEGKIVWHLEDQVWEG